MLDGKVSKQTLSISRSYRFHKLDTKYQEITSSSKFTIQSTKTYNPKTLIQMPETSSL